ncbi:MAG: extracellular solute-binding protein, partial [Candidatus Promineifilaceae bacterium]
MFSRKSVVLFTMLVVLALALVACGGGTTEESTAAATEAAPAEGAAPTEAPAETAPAMAEVDWAVIPGGYMERALNGEFSGTTVTVDGPFVDADQVRFEQSMKAFEDATGIDVQYIGNKEFETSIQVRVQAGDTPDIADFPQPATVADFAQQGHIVDVSTFIPE